MLLGKRRLSSSFPSNPPDGFVRLPPRFWFAFAAARQLENTIQHNSNVPPRFLAHAKLPATIRVAFAPEIRRPHVANNVSKLSLRVLISFYTVNFYLFLFSSSPIVRNLRNDSRSWIVKFFNFSFQRAVKRMETQLIKLN